MKRAADILISVIALAVLAPVLAITALLIRIKLGGPVLFKQERPGKDGRVFVLVKFRTMKDARNTEGEQLDDSERLTGFGKILRATSVDELPELWNVLKGDMSVVGPRPLLVEYLPLYSKEQARRHEVKPGITGWAQINGRNAISWEQKFEFDIWYVDNRSMWIDLIILMKTPLRLLKTKDVNSSNHATMELFKGSKNR
jgi:sugar transferase EpsL